MSDWFLNLSIPWMAFVVFAATYLTGHRGPGSLFMVLNKCRSRIRARIEVRGTSTRDLPANHGRCFTSWTVDNGEFHAYKLDYTLRGGRTSTRGGYTAPGASVMVAWGAAAVTDVTRISNYRARKTPIIGGKRHMRHAS